jgi:hypothetical protein
MKYIEKMFVEFCDIIPLNNKYLHKFVFMDQRPVRIYSTEDVPRLRYIAGIILGNILGLSWEVTTDKRKLGKHPVINYSAERIPGSFKIFPDTLLFEKGISAREIIVKDWKGLPVFFQTDQDSDIPFDIFAASFFLVSRYEEYLEHMPDEYGRFKACSSLAFNNGFLGIPIVDIWAKEMAKVFLKKSQSLAFKRNDYNALVTFDIDQPFAYLGKSLFRSLGGFIKDLKSHTGKATDRYRIIARGEKDPYEIFDYITESINKYRSDARFFIPVGDHSKYDKNPSWKNDEYRQLIIRLSRKYQVGLHPSFYASDNSLLVRKEAAHLKTVLEREIVISRFHYVRLFMPQSYLNIHNAGITEDYSMGYPDEPGFRAGIARPFYFYNISDDTETNLKIVPFQVMDATLYKYKNLDPGASKELISKLVNETRKVGGLFVSIWHNTSLLENAEWQGWREVFEFMLKTQIP